MGEIMNQPDFHQVPIRCGWKETRMLIRGPLTDKKLAKYEKLGWYSEDFRQLRRDRMNKNRTRRQGSFLETEGRLTYNPQ